MSPERVARRAERVAQVRALFDQKLSYDAIAAEMGTTKSAISLIAFKNGFPKRRMGRRARLQGGRP